MIGGASSLVLVLADEGDIVYDRDGNKVRVNNTENPMHIVLGYTSNRSVVKKELTRMIGNNTFMTVLMTSEWKSTKSIPLTNTFAVNIFTADRHQLHLKSITSSIVDLLSKSTFTSSISSPLIEVTDVKTVTIPRVFKLRFAFSTNNVISDYVYPSSTEQLLYKCFVCEKEADFFDASVVKAFCSKTCATSL